MKKQLILAATLIAMTSASSFGQGYFLFAANKNSVFDAFTTQGVSVSGGGHTIAGFIFGPQSTTNSGLGSVGNPTGNVGGVSPDKWLAALNDPQYHLATNQTSGALVSVNVNPAGLAIGGISYLGGATFIVANTVGGQQYTMYAIAWDNAFPDPYTAAASGRAFGWSNPFQYAAGNGPISTPLTFSASGMTAFGVSPIPEPTTFALAGLGAAALLIFRRRK